MNSKIIFDFSNLEGKIKQFYDTQDKFCKLIPMSRATLNQKLNNKKDFSASNIWKMAKLLNMSVDEIGTVFFREKNLEN